MLVEDDAGLREALERRLRSYGIEVRAYPSAELALADDGQKGADCLILDLDLPNMSGLDLVDCLRQRGVAVPAVIMTAYDKPSARAEARRRGVRHFLAKPFSGSALAQLLEEVIASGDSAPSNG